MSGEHLIGAQSLHVAWPLRTVLEDVTLGVAAGDRIGVVGRNGDGKSTLLNLLAGHATPHGGRVTVRGGTRVGMLAQDDLLDPAASVRTAIVGDVPDHVWASDPRIRDILAGLVSDLPGTARIGDLSGGQRRRTDLARLLIGDWDVLMLDEPTNHLDVEGITWLAHHLRRRWSPRDGALLAITHDRWFLDEVSTTTWEIHDGVVDAYDGGYAAYVLQRVERQRQTDAAEAKRQNLMRKELAWLRRGAPARTTKPKFRIDAANALIAGEPPVRNSVALTQLATSRLGKRVVDLESVAVDYGGGPVLEDVTWRIAPGERTGILGANGAGKSTLMGLVAGTVDPSAGEVKRGKTVELAHLSQRMEGLDAYLDLRLADVMNDRRSTYHGAGEELSPSQLLERLGFTSSALGTRVKELSGGQRRRLQLLLTLLDEPNVLLLDEPTNDMDTDMLAAVEDLLDTWPGTLLVVSHDRYLLERVTDQQYAVLGTDLRHLPGGVEEYLALRRAEDAERSGPSAGGTSGGAGRADASAGNEAGEGPKRGGAEERALAKELGSLERKMEKLQGRIEAANQAMLEVDPAAFEELAQRTAAVKTLQSELDEVEERWVEVGSALEE